MPHNRLGLDEPSGIVESMFTTLQPEISAKADGVAASVR
jgi:hypothetical protein